MLEERCPQGSGAPPHVHVYDDEAFYVLEGDVEFVAGDKRALVHSGSFVYIPRGTVHMFKVRSATARLLNLYTHAGFERIIQMTCHKTEQRAVPPSALPPPHVSPERISELFAEVGMQTVAVPNPLE